MITTTLLSFILCINVTSTDFLDAVCKVESNCNPSAIGDNGNAIGAYQIWKSYWQDAVEHDPSIGGVYKDCLNKAYSEKIVRAYMDRYATERRLGRPVTDEDRARMHNGGPRAVWATGKKKRNLDIYWGKVKRELGGKKPR
jgi:hypothetical protein